MSLKTDIIFVKALRSNASLIKQLPAGNVYNAAIALPKEQADNAPLPNIIVTYEGLNNQEFTKDDAYEGLSDTVTIGIDTAAKNREQLAELVIMVRQTIKDYFRQHINDDEDEDFRLIPNSIQLQAGPVIYDKDKPCYWQVLTFYCDTNPD